MWQELRYSIRSLLRARRFVGVTVSVFATGVGLSAFILTAVYATLWNPLPIRNPSEIVYVNQSEAGHLFAMPYTKATEVLRLRDLFVDTALRTPDRAFVPSDAVRPRWSGERVSWNYFHLLGLQPVIGRLMTDADDQPGATPTILISRQLWRTRFADSGDVIGTRIRLDPRAFGPKAEPGRDYTIIGVMDDDATRLTNAFAATDYWVPFTPRTEDYACDRTTDFASVVARRRPDVAFARVAQSIRAHDERLAASHTPDVTVAVNQTRVSQRRLAGLALTLATLILVVTVTNISGLLMTRTADREVADSVRYALGADRWSAGRQTMLEGLLIAGAGGVVAAGLVRAMAGAVSAGIPLAGVTEALGLITTRALHWRSLTAFVGACLLLGLIAGGMAAHRAWRPRHIASASAGGHGLSRRRRRRAHWILVPQIGLAVGIVFCAAVVGVHALAVERLQPGYDAEQVAFVNYLLPGPSRCLTSAATLQTMRDQRSMTDQRILSALETATAGGMAALSSSVPVAPLTNWVVARDHTSGVLAPLEVSESSVSPGYFDVLNIRVLQGRRFDARDVVGGPAVAMISAALADRLWPGDDPIGKELSFYHPASPDARTWRQVIGIVSDIRLPLSDGAVRPWLYAPLNANGGYAVMRTRGGGVEELRQLASTVQSSNPALVVQEQAVISSVIANQRSPRRLAAVLLTIASLLTGIVACAGLYSLVAYSTMRRIPEFGLRLALGASRLQVVRLVIGEGLALSAGGVIAGVIVSALAVGLAAGVIPDMPRIGFAAIGVIAAIVAAIVAAACYGPARRAADVDPLVSLRHL